MIMKIKQREINQAVYNDCLTQGYSEPIARILAGRLTTFDKRILTMRNDSILPGITMADCPKAAERIVKAIKDQENIGVFTDYDVDGCTAMAVLYRSLKCIFGVQKERLKPIYGNRKNDGYGITEKIVDKILSQDIDVLITADAGSSDQDRIARLSEAGIDVIVTDHHLFPVEGLPSSAFAVINPQREDCPYDTRIAGVGVAWLLMTAVSQVLECSPEQKKELFQLLDFVALGTVADMVGLDSPINRVIVHRGLEFMNTHSRDCWRQFLNGQILDTGFLGFQAGPRINAVSRMTGVPSAAMAFLTSEDPAQVEKYFKKMDQCNDIRKGLEQKMFGLALSQCDENAPCAIAFHESFDPGVQGIVASKLSKKTGKPAIMLAPVQGNPDLIVGSGRAGQFLHLRDAFQAVEDRNPGFFVKFGGHAAAAGLSIYKDDLDRFKEEFAKAVEDQLDGVDTTPYILVDGSLRDNLSLEAHKKISRLAPFGQGFPAPEFCDTMTVSGPRMIGKNPVHLKMELNGIEAVMFNAIENPEQPVPVRDGEKIKAVYHTSCNAFGGNESLQLMVQHIEVPAKSVA